MKIVCVADAKCTLGEGPLWDERAGVLYWVDIKAPAIWRLDRQGGSAHSWPMPHLIGAIALREQGGFVAAMKPGFAFVDVAKGEVEIVARPEPDLPDNRLNDGACDPTGRFWAGSMDDNEKAPTGHLYRLDPDRRVTRFEAGFVITNGIRWSVDGRRMYFVDSAARTVWVYGFDLVNGVPGMRQVFARLSEADGWPDGLCVDADDHVWLAHWGAARVTRFRPDGTKEREIAIPAPNVTSGCFGGPALDTLYVTTARIGLNDAELQRFPQAGGVFALEGLGVCGRPSPRFAG